MASETRNELASDRTDLAEDRTLLANERTFAGWARTSFAAIGIGLGFNALFDRLEPAWLPKTIATAFLLLAVFTIVTAERRAARVVERLSSHEIKSMRPVNLRVIAGVIVAATAALIAALWMLV